MPIISCEHASNQVPGEWVALFSGDRRRVLASHRGWDPGAREVAGALASRVGCPHVHEGNVTRLLVDLNRSHRNPRIWSEISRSLDARAKEGLLAEFWRPYRLAVLTSVMGKVDRRGTALHLSVHTFTPFFNGIERVMDVGLLYDPADHETAEFCKAWRGRLRDCWPDLKIRMNAPYRGVNDSIVTSFRKMMKPGRYLGVEIEVNQKYFSGPPERWSELLDLLARSFEEIVHEWTSNPKARNRPVSLRACV